VHFETAMSQLQAQDFESARVSFEQSIALDPDNAVAHRWLGTLCARRQAYAEAEKHLERAMALAPAEAEIWVDLGNVQALQRHYGKARVSYQSAIEMAPDAALAHLNMGWVLKELGSLEEALVHLRIAYRLEPDLENALRNLVAALVESDRCEEALALAGEAAARNPAEYDAQFCLGLAHQKLHDPEKALASYESASRLRANDPELHDNRGTALLELGRLDEAIASYDRALALRPEFALPAFHRALTRLLRGDFREGWDQYELRKLDRHYPGQPDLWPSWEGSPLAGQTLLISREQGLGDEIMFASCLPQLMGMARHCIVECEPRLLGIFRRSFPGATVYATAADGGMPDEIRALKPDFVTPAGSVPRFIRRNAGEFPRHQGYLRADPERIARWRARLAQLGPQLKVGVSWAGGVRKTRRVLRSVALDHWLPILGTPGVRFVSLQYTTGAEQQVAELRERHGVPMEHWAEAIHDYEETAALVCALDLVLSVCTAVVHLGGALARPVWVMAPYSPEWRYGFSGDTMPWYPSVKLFRQSSFGSWEPVIASVASELGRLTATGAR
jgi:tetratricopeptide (TPR) repeat protein